LKRTRGTALPDKSIDSILKMTHYDEYTIPPSRNVNEPTRTFDNRSLFFKRLHQ
jgi:hypothetical protein